MGEQTYRRNAINLWRILISLRFGLILMFLLAGSATLGVLLPQQLPQPGTTIGEVLRFFGLDNVFATWWFQLLAYMLALNVLACLFNRIGAVFSVVRYPRMTVGSLDRLKSFDSFVSKERSDVIVDKSVQVLLANRYRVLQNIEDEQVQLYADKQRFELLGSVFIHFGVLCLIAGLTWVGLTGFEGTVTVPVGSTFRLSDMKVTKGTLPKDFAVKVVSAQQRINRVGLWEVKPTLSIVDKGAVVKTAQIGYSSPIHYNGLDFRFIRFIGGVLVTVNNKSEVVIPNQANYFPLDSNNDLYVAFAQIYADPNRPTVEYMIVQPSSPQPLEEGVLRAGEGINYQNQFSFALVGYQGIAVIRASRQPGMGLVLAGAVLLFTGICLSLYLCYRKIWLTITPEGDQIHVMAGGYSSKQRLRFASEFGTIINDIRGLTGG